MKNSKQTFYWTEPRKINFKWNCEKKDFDNKILDVKTFKTEGEAWSFLKTINVYANGELV